MTRLDIETLFKGIINSYGQIFFSTKYWFAILLLLVTFFDPYAGMAGLLAVFFSNLTAIIFGFNKTSVHSGLYGFNALLVGLGLGIYFDFSFTLIFIVAISAILTLFLSVMFEGVLYKYGLPFLSIPFLLVIWILNLAVIDFTALGLNERGVYLLNEIYSIGGKDLVNIYQWWYGIVNSNILTTYFISLGAIFFQYNVFAGILISIGLLIYSRIAFSLSLIGYFSAYLFYLFIGSHISNVGYMYIGFNYILTAIAIGGFFIVPSKTSYLWTILLIPLVAILTISFHNVFQSFGISIYSLPFNIIVLLFIYVLKLRIKPNTDLKPVIVQENSPEKNLYSHLNYKNTILNWQELIPIQLPFFGEWHVSQAHNGKYTHKGEWKHAWDFVIKNNDKEFNSFGNKPDHFLCYNKAIIAPAAGVVESIVDGIDDNEIGEVNVEQNWGNTIIIKHSDFLYSKLSHLKKGSFVVEKGDYVNTGQEIARCGNTGRSPSPHLHFQLQETPFVGSRTISYPIASFYKLNDGDISLHNFDLPEKNDIVKRPLPEKILQKAFNFVPGYTLSFNVEGTNETIAWDVQINFVGETYIKCRKTKAKAFFVKTNDLFYFTGFRGEKNNYLFKFYLSAQKIHMSFFEAMNFSELIRPNDVYKGLNLFLQDFIAPFYIWLKPKYSITYSSKKLGFTSMKIDLRTRIKTRRNKQVSETQFEITERGLIRISFDDISLLKTDETTINA